MRAGGGLLLLGLLAGCPAAIPPAPDDVALERYHEANAHWEAGKFAEAIPLYEFVLSRRDRIREAYHRLSWCYEVLGQEERAILTLERLLRIDRRDEYSLWNLLRMYTHRGRLEEAVGACKALLEARPNDPELRGELTRLEGLRQGR